MTAYTKVCDYIQTTYKIDIEIQKAEINMIQMEMCMDTYQHMLDTGQCDKLGQANGCFQSMVGCVNFNQLDSTMKNVGTYVTEANSIFGDQSGIVAMECNGQNLNQCCPVKSGESTGSAGANCVPSTVKFISTGSTTCTGTLYVTIDNVQGQFSLNSDAKASLAQDFNGISRNMYLWCRSSDGKTATKLGTGMAITLLKQSTASSPPEKCTCPGSGQGNPAKQAGCCYVSTSNCIDTVYEDACNIAGGTLKPDQSCSDVPECPQSKGGSFAQGSLSITNFVTSFVVSSSATFTWTTNKAATSQVGCMDMSGNPPLSSAKDTNMVTSHTQQITGLESSTTYSCFAVSQAGTEKAISPGTYQISTPTPTVNPTA
jgi:hypothetical protein